MKMKISQQLTHWLGVVAVGLVVGLSVQFVRAWTEPTAAPPDGNVGAPINTGNNTQYKLGNLELNNGASYLVGLTVNGQTIANGSVSVGTTSLGSSVWPFTQNSLYIKGPAATDGTIVIDTTDSTGTNCDAGITLAKNGIGKWWIGNDCEQPDSLAIWDIDNDTGRIYVTQNGNVGIGTTSPTDTLEVNGTIRGQHVFVDNYNNVAFGGIIWTTNSTTFVDIPQTNKDVTVPAGTALIIWQMSACGNGGSVDALVRVCIDNDCGPTINPFIAAGPLNDHCNIYNKSFGGSFVTNVTSGTKTVKLQVRRVVGPAGNFKTSSDDYVNWSIMVFRD